MDLYKNFRMFLSCHFPNPSFSPKLSAKTRIIGFTDFTVTQGSHLPRAEVSRGQSSESTGNLLDDTSLEVLNNTKSQAKEVAIKLEDAENKTK